MKNGRIEIRHNFAGELGYVILKAYKTTNLSVAIPGMTEVYSAPHSEAAYLKTEIDPVMYVVKAFRSSDGVAEDQQINSLACDASALAVYTLETFYYVVGRGQGVSSEEVTWADPEEGDTQINDTRLKDKKFTVEERATGKLLPVEEMGGEWEPLTDGGFKFVDTEKQFWEGGVYAVTVQYRSNIVVSDEVGIAGLKIITEDQNFAAEDYGKTILANGATVAKITYTIPAFNTIADGELRFSNNLPGQRYLVIQLGVGNTISIGGEDFNRISLSPGDCLTIIKAGSLAYVTREPISYTNLGKTDFVYKVLPSQYPLDGSEHNLADFPKVEDYINTLPGGQVVSFTTWNSSQVIAAVSNDGVERTVYPYKGMWAIDNVNGKFKFPDFRKLTVRGYQGGETDRLVNQVGGLQSGRTPRHALEVNDYYYIDSAGSFPTAPNKETLPSGYNGNRGSGSTDSDNNTVLFRRHYTLEGGRSTDMGGSVDNIGLIAVINI